MLFVEPQQTTLGTSLLSNLPHSLNGGAEGAAMRLTLHCFHRRTSRLIKRLCYFFILIQNNPAGHTYGLRNTVRTARMK